jgi:DNA-directed RNA polymerase subunit M/transcription elongation factor TFIIS
MSLKHCPNCGGLIRLPELQAGHAVRCNKCGYTFAVPDRPPVTESQRHAAEREERRLRRARRERKAATKSNWLVPVLVLGGAVLLVGSGVLLSGCWR